MTSSKNGIKPPNAATPTAFDHLHTLAEYQPHCSRIFPSVDSLRWFMQQHRKELLAAGAVVQLAGRIMIDGPKFEAATLAIGQKTAEDRSERGGRD